MVSERGRRKAAYKGSIDAVVAYIDGEDADLFNLLDEAAKADALVASYRLAFIAAKAVEEVAAVTRETPREVLGRLIRETQR